MMEGKSSNQNTEEKLQANIISSRNMNAEIWRIVFCAVIVIYHVGMVFEKNLLGVGYLCVEFYFILSGYGIYRACLSYRKKRQKKVRAFFGYAAGRLKRLYPLYLAAMLVSMLVQLIAGQLAIGGVFSYIRDCAAEFFMLQCSPLGNSVMLLTDWYVATLFWGSLLFMALLLVGGKVTTFVICPAVSLWIYAYYARLIAKIDVIVAHYGFLRALAGLALGIFLGAVCELICKHTGEKAKKEEEKQPAGERVFERIRIPLMILSNLLLMAVTVYYQFGQRSLKDFVVIGIFFVSLLMMMVSGVKLSELANKPIRILSKLTYPIYLFQLPVLQLLAYLLK